jgi:antitoxin ParD1/3/4
MSVAMRPTVETAALVHRVAPGGLSTEAENATFSACSLHGIECRIRPIELLSVLPALRTREKSVTIQLPPEVEESIRLKVRQGRFADAGEVVREAMRLLEIRDHREQEVRDSIAEGFAAIERGEGIELTAESLQERSRRAGERVRRGETPNSDVCP